ncbi:Ig-like domain-containing protein, partial [uncultured Finegoldia sp.]|uniref:Ig-like domain-containing protein n=1 Tax=uncultured Finegoldia sp. TaxID=328009 RepID=UPI0026382D05
MNNKKINNIAKILLAFGVLASPMVLANQVSADNAIVKNDSVLESKLQTPEENKNQPEKDEEKPKVDNATSKKKEDVSVVAPKVEDKSTTEKVEPTTEKTDKVDEGNKNNATPSGTNEKKEDDFTAPQPLTAENNKPDPASKDEPKGNESKEDVKTLENAENNAENKKENNKETKSEDKLEIFELKSVDQLREPAGETTGNDISAQLEELKVNLYANNEAKNGTKVTPLRGPIEANEGQDIGMDISFYVPKTVKKGDYFDIKLSDTVNGYGATSKDVAYKPKLYVGDDVVAEGSYDPTTNTFRYVFTEAAQKYGRFRQDINEVLYVDPKNVKNSKEGVEVSANLNGETKKNFDVDYSLELKDGDVEIPSNGAGTINELKENKDLGEKKGTYEQTYYVNYAGKKQNGTELTFENNDKAGDHGITTESEAIFDDDVLNSVKVYKVKDPSKLNGSFYVEDDNIEEVDSNQYDKELITTGNGLEKNGMKIKFKNQGSTDTYVVKYQGKYDPKKFVQIKSTMIANPNEAYSSAVHASTVSLKSAKSAPKADEGFFWENHIFQTLDEDGKVVSTDFIHDFVNYAHGTKEETYRTEKQDVAGYEIYKVENQDEAQADSLGNETTGHFVKGKRSKALYFYRKIQGSLTVWQDEEGNDVQQPEDGLKDKIDAPAGYTFVKSEPTETLKNGKKKNKHIYHKIVTRYVEEGEEGKELKEKVDGAHPDTAGTAVENYHKVGENTDPKTGDVTNIYHKIITKWVDDKGKVLKGPEDGPKPDNDGVWDIPEYKLVGEPKVDPKTGDVTNIYKKIEVDYTAWVDDEGNRIKQPEKTLKDKGDDPDGYKFTGTTEEKDGDTTRRIHHYRRLKTRWVTDVDSEELKDEEYGSKKYEDFKADFEGYKFLKTKVRKDGDVVNIYHKIVTQWIDKDTLDPLKPKEDGAKPDDDGNDIANYKFVKKVVDPENGNIINYYHQIKTRWVEMGTGTELKNTEVGAHPDDDGKWDIPEYGLVSSVTDVKTGDVTNIYQKLLPPYTIWVDEDGKQIKELEDGLKEKGNAPDGYVFVKSSENEEIEGGKGHRNVHIYRKVVTKYVDENGKEIPDNPPVVGTHDKKDIPGYEYVKKTGGGSDGDVIHVYKKKTKKTSYVDLNGNEIPNNPPEDGTHEKKEISGYTFDKTETDEDGNVKHIYKKVVVKTSYVDEDGGEIKDNPPVEGAQEKKDIPGYKFVETKNVDNGDVIHVYKKISPKTSYVDDNGKEIDGHPTVDGKKEKADIPGYSYQGEEDKDGNTIHKYHKIVTKYV